MRNIGKLAFLLSSVSLYARENKAGWKLDADGRIEMKDGNPVYIQSDGREMVMEASTVGSLNGEAKAQREARQRAEADLKKYEGIDPEKARVALETLEKLDQKTLIDAGEVDKVKAQITEQYTGKLSEAENTNKSLRGENNNLKLDLAFTSSKFMDRFSIPSDMVRAAFGRHFEFGDDGKIVPKDQTGNPIYSKQRIGEVASFDEALEILVEQYPGKDAILKAPDARGSGNSGNGGGRTGNKATVTRTEFDNMTPADKAATNAAMGKGEVQLIDG
jgi:hypothetical protein